MGKRKVKVEGQSEKVEVKGKTYTTRLKNGTAVVVKKIVDGEKKSLIVRFRFLQEFIPEVEAEVYGVKVEALRKMCEKKVGDSSAVVYWEDRPMPKLQKHLEDENITLRDRNSHLEEEMEKLQAQLNSGRGHKKDPTEGLVDQEGKD